MAKRNTFGVDETLESTFSWEMIRRCFVYIRREGRLFLRAFVLQALAMVAGLCGPLFSARVLDEAAAFIDDWQSTDKTSNKEGDKR